MHPTASRCVRWAVALFVVGAALIVFGPRIFAALADAAGPGAHAVVDLVDVTLTLVRWTLMPIGASLIGAAVVIQTLTSSDARPTRDHLQNYRPGAEK